MNNRIVRITPVPASFRYLLAGQLEYMQQFYSMIAISSHDYNYDLKHIKKDEVSTITVEMSRKITPIKDLVSIYKMVVLMTKISPAVVHTHTPKAGFIGCVASKIVGVKSIIHTVAGMPLMEAEGMTKILLLTIEKIIYKSAHRIYPNSFGLMEYILKMNLCKKDKIKVILNGSSNGIDTEHFKPSELINQRAISIRAKEKIPDSALVVCFIGRIVADKGVNELVEAFIKIRANDENVHLFLIGPHEDDLDPVSDRTKTIIINDDRIHYFGLQQDVRPYLLASNILAFPSYREGFPNVPMQAGAMGLPSIVTNINGCNEIIEHNTNGILVEPKDAVALEEALTDLLHDAVKRNRMACASRNMIVSRFSQIRIWESLLKEYENFGTFRSENV